jgi:N utilization substance protein A
VAREPGYRSKIAVVSHASGVDPVGACVGPRGSRVRMVVSELRGEKIDIIPFNEEPARFIAKALSPARVREVLVDDDSKQATVVVPDDQLSLAIGREGLNARLAARLTGWRIDIRSETEFAQEEAEGGYEEEVASGRCAAILTSGRRCPNAALPGSRFCGLPAHQALAETGSDYVGGEPPEGEERPIEDDDDEVVAEEAVADEAVAEEAVADEGVVDVDEASSAVEVETPETDTGDEEIESVDVERTAHDDVDEAVVTEADLEGPGGEGQ